MYTYTLTPTGGRHLDRHDPVRVHCIYPGHQGSGSGPHVLRRGAGTGGAQVDH